MWYAGVPWRSGRARSFVGPSGMRHSVERDSRTCLRSRSSGYLGGGLNDPRSRESLHK